MDSTTTGVSSTIASIVLVHHTNLFILMPHTLDYDNVQVMCIVRVYVMGDETVLNTDCPIFEYKLRVLLFFYYLRGCKYDLGRWGNCRICPCGIV